MSISNKNYSLYYSLESEVKVKETVNNIVQQEENIWSKESDEFMQFFKGPDWNEKRKLYLKIEELLRENRVSIPTWEVTGALHFGMSPADMKEVVIERLREMAKSGRLKQENTIEQREKYFPNNKSRHDLTRVWGSQFLQKNLEKDNRVKVAEHFIILNENVSEIEIEIWLFNDQYPCVTSINSTSGYILSEKIMGQRKAADYKLPSLIDAGFSDFSDPGNILEDTNQVGWVVDTEAKSFDKPSIKGVAYAVTAYLKKRFHFLHADETRTIIKIPVSDIF